MKFKKSATTVGDGLGVSILHIINAVAEQGCGYNAHNQTDNKRKIFSTLP